eukprot:scaffold2093_cov425-Prasinococcus_capsulatus_cf.AAC.5
MGGQQPQIYQAQQMPYQQPQDQGLTFMSFPEDSSAKTGTFGMSTLIVCGRSLKAHRSPTLRSYGLPTAQASFMEAR